MSRWSPLQANGPQLLLMPCKSYLILPEWLDIWSVLPNNHIHSLWHVCYHSTGWVNFPIPFSQYVSMPAPFHHVKLALCTDDTFIIVMYCKPGLLGSYLEAYFIDLEWWLGDWRIAINTSKRTLMLFTRSCRCILKTSSVQLFGEPVHWVDTTHFQGVTL